MVLGNVDFASNVYRHFGESPWWEGAGQATGQGFGNVHKVSDLMGDFGKGINSFKKGLAEKEDPKVINAEDTNKDKTTV